MWVCITDNRGKLLCRYDPARRLIEFVRRGQKTVIDLDEYEPNRVTEGTIDFVAQSC